MNHCCREICKTIKVPKAWAFAYKNGLKRCTNCEVFIKHAGNFCPCCGQRLKYSPMRKNRREVVRVG